MLLRRLVDFALSVGEEILTSRRRKREEQAAHVLRLEQELAHLGDVVRALAPRIDADIAKLNKEP